MMMMTIKRILILLPALILTTAKINSQGKDFGIWMETGASYKLRKNLDIETAAAIRTAENTTMVDQYFAEGGLNYKLSGNFSTGALYRITNKIENNSEYYLRHLIFLNIKGEADIRQFNFSGKLTWQRTVKTYIEDSEDLKSINYLRFRAMVTYNFKTLPINPFLNYEPYLTISGDDSNELRKIRFSTGFELKISQKSSTEVRYIYENFMKASQVDSNILSLKYNLRF